MQCHSLRENLTAYLYGELDKKDVMAIHRHLSQCQTCAQEELELRKTIRILNQTHPEVLPKNFKDELNHKLMQTKMVSKLIKRDFRRVLYAVAATFIITLGIEFFAYQLYCSIPDSGNLANLPPTKAVFRPAKQSIFTKLSRKNIYLKKYLQYQQRHLNKTIKE